MGSPLGHMLAKLFMSFHEKRCLGQFNFCDVLLHCQYVDSIFCLFNCEQDIGKVFKILNSQNP